MTALPAKITIRRVHKEIGLRTRLRKTHNKWIWKKTKRKSFSFEPELRGDEYL